MMHADDDSVQQKSGKKMKPAVPLDDDSGGGSDPPRRNNNNNNNSRDDNGGGGGDESFLDKMKRMTANCCQATGLCCFKFKEQSQISALDYKITQRQKKFGVDYLNMVQEKAPQDQLKGCLRDALKDISVLQEQMNEHFDNIEDRKEEVERKIQREPGAGGSRPNTAASKPASRPAASSSQGDDDDAEKNDGDSEEEPKPKQPKRTKSKSKKKEEEPAEAEAEAGENSGEARAAPKKKKTKKKPPPPKDENFSIDDE